MTFLELILSLEIRSENLNIVEDFESLSCKISLSGVELLQKAYTFDFLNDLFETVRQNDTMTLSINNDGDSIVIIRDKKSIQLTLDDNDYRLYEDAYIYTIELVIQKQLSNDISIYSSNAFIKWLKKQETFINYLNKFEKLMTLSGKIVFTLLDNASIELCTKKFSFQSNQESYPNKRKILDQRKEHCFISGREIPEIIPEDFYILTESEDNELNLLFNKIALLITFTFLLDISETKDNSIYYKLYGYKTIENELTLNNLKVDALKQIYKIYEWIYHDKNHSTISDKLGITRNLLTLHIRENRLDNIEGDIFTAIKSNFDIYLKENVQRYLEVKNQVSTFIHEMSLKAESHTEGFVDVFKNSLLVFISYFLSIITVTAIDKGKFVNMFTFEVTVITIVILIISWLYRKNTVKDIQHKEDRFKEKYINFKERYVDILEPENFNSIFNNDKDHKSDVKYIEDTLNKYDPLWKGTIIIFGLLTITFCFFQDTANCFDKLIQGIGFIWGLFAG
ncbi:MAG: hypothetical protein LHW46_06480 [Candidatus Cloacimonetes bacterium]|nr:hypothetical protein [Candidatus Cloacimonadota bacterium]